MNAPVSLEELSKCLAKLPGVGRRSAERMALKLVRDPDGLLRDLAAALEEAGSSICCCSRCGTVTTRDADPCRLCIEACPTGALRDERTLTTRRCISYLTIEHGGELQPDSARAIGGSLFGCDCCTAICPWNRYGADRIMPELTEHPCPTPRELAAMDEAAFGTRFKDTVVWRTGLQRLKRNAAAVCENASEGSVHHRDREARRNSP